MISCPAYLDQTTVPRDLDTLQRPQPQVCDGLCIGHLEARWAVFVWKEIFVEDFDDEEILRSTLSLENALIYLRPPITASTQTSAQADAEKRSEVSVERRRTDTTGGDQILGMESFATPQGGRVHRMHLAHGMIRGGEEGVARKMDLSSNNAGRYPTYTPLAGFLCRHSHRGMAICLKSESLLDHRP